MKNRLHLAAAILLAVAAHAAAQSAQDRIRKDELAFMQDQEPAMRRAFEKARATLDDFLAKSKSPPTGATSFALKVGIKDGKDTEYFWITDFQEDDGKFTGKIDNEPRMVKRVKRGQDYSFPREHIVDWTYVDQMQRKMMGNF